jgi:hypothetical protein
MRVDSHAIAIAQDQHASTIRPLMPRVAHRLQIGLVLLAWLAQLVLPLAQAAIMTEPPAKVAGWCGDASRAHAVIGQLPVELRQAFDLPAAGAEQLDACGKLCTVAGTVPVLPALVTGGVVRVAEAQAPPVIQPVLIDAEPAFKPPSHGPPLRP